MSRLPRTRIPRHIVSYWVIPNGCGGLCVRYTCDGAAWVEHYGSKLTGSRALITAEAKREALRLENYGVTDEAAPSEPDGDGESHGSRRNAYPSRYEDFSERQVWRP